MGQQHSHKGMGLIVYVALSLVACGGVASPPTATLVPQEPTSAPESVIALGKTVFVTKVCSTCHIVKGYEETVGVVGPDLTTIYSRAANTIHTAAYKASMGKAKTAVDYIRKSILDPNAFIYPDCPTAACQPSLMIENFKETIAPNELEALIAYLVSLR
jgi:cytochrome c2